MRAEERIARTVGSLMVDVVAYGTGVAAALPDVKVAGTTGTAELEDTRDPETGETLPPDPTNTDAWFTSYAPVEHPKIVVAVMIEFGGHGWQNFLSPTDDALFAAHPEWFGKDAACRPSRDPSVVFDTRSADAVRHVVDGAHILRRPAPELDGKYTVFGKVIKGMDVVNKIQKGDVITRAYLKDEAGGS